MSPTRDGCPAHASLTGYWSDFPIESQPFCFPVCVACREAPCPKAFTPKVKRQVRPWAPRELPPERMTCGHVMIPWPVFHVFGSGSQKMEVWCDEDQQWVSPVPPPKPLTKRQQNAEDAKKWPELPPF